MIQIALMMKSEEGSEYRDRLQKEFDETINPLLRAVLLDCAHYVYTKYGKYLTITQLVRTPEENKKISVQRDLSQGGLVIEVE